MNSKELDAVIRSSSPTTRERLRTTLTNYQSMLTSRIASIKELATKEEVLRAQCGFGPLPSSSVRTSESLRSTRVPGRGQSPAVSKSTKLRSENSTPIVRANTSRITSALLHFTNGKSRVPSRQHESDEHERNMSLSPSIQKSPRRSVSPPPQPANTPPPSPQLPLSHHQQNETSRHTSNMIIHSNDHVGHHPVGGAADDRPTSFTNAERELKQLFHRQKVAHKQLQHHRRTSMDDSTSQRPSGLLKNTSMISSSSVLSASMSSSSLGQVPNEEGKSTRSEYHKLVERNQLLRKRVEEVLANASRDSEAPSTSPKQLSASTGHPQEGSLCLCLECLEWSAEAVERTLPVLFDCVQAMVGNAISPKSIHRTTSVSTADDESTLLLHKEIATLQREKVLLRLRRVELLAARLHHQRISWFRSSTLDLLGGAEVFSSMTTLKSHNGLNDDDGVTVVGVAHTIPSAVDILDALESALAARLSFATLVKQESSIARVQDRLQSSLQLLSTLSMLSELQWCAEEAVQNTQSSASLDSTRTQYIQ
ncbi:Hypothetical protein, putative [Bodo saltans]|uniref:Uncharacterized protein n=1 Tax=Bodo saltans TaxID=75058 RepID=A0A0S4INK8_BODSA|nr:Hypothetical protein, putative [Bodo saltans]|eukprot:CUF67676.1 Hypothetical protein, putative [Bodo saltans]